MSMRLTQVALAGLFLTLGVRDAAAEVMRWQIDGETREAIVNVPASPGREGAPLVLSFHGYGDNMQNFQYTNVHEAWPDAIVVYFQGLETRGGLPGWQYLNRLVVRLAVRTPNSLRRKSPTMSGRSCRAVKMASATRAVPGASRNAPEGVTGRAIA